MTKKYLIGTAIAGSLLTVAGLTGMVAQGQQASVYNLGSNSRAIQSINKAELLPCLSGDTTPQVKVVSPNGGEVFSPGQQITVKWSTCNISATQNMGILIGWDSVVPVNPVTLSVMPTMTVPNTGTTTFTLPTNSLFSGQYTLQYGFHYKIVVKLLNGAQAQVSDESDNLFSINSSGPQVGTCNNNNPVKLIMTGIDSNGGPGDPISPGSQKKALSRLVLYSTCDLLVDKLEVYNTDYFASQGFSKFYIHKGYGTNMNGNATGVVLGSVSSSNPAGPMGGVITLNPAIQLIANMPQAITISGDVNSNISASSDKTFQMCLMGPGNDLKDANGNILSQLPGNVLPTTILGRMTCGQFLKLQ